MKSIFTYLFPLVVYTSFAQNSEEIKKDTTTSVKDVTIAAPSNGINFNQYNSFSNSRAQKHLVIKENLVFATSNIKMSAIEVEISDLEAMECKAILKRDTATLKKIWARDF